MTEAKFSPKDLETKGNPDIKAVDKKVDYLLAVMVGVIIVLFVGFMTLLVMVAQMMLTCQSRL